MKLTLAANYCDFDSVELLLDDVASRGIRYIEMPCGGFFGKAYLDPSRLLQSDAALTHWLKKATDRGVEIACLSVQGNPVHPDARIAYAHTKDLKDAIDLAERLGIPTVIAFSGLPGGCSKDRAVSWPVGGITEEMYNIYQYQWNEVLIPHWRELGEYARKRNVKIAIELHSGMAVHTPHTFLKLRDAVNDSICANVDTGHLWWQGIEPARAIDILGAKDTIGHIHLRDAHIRPDLVDLYGVTGSYLPEDTGRRGWVFSAMGYGHSINEWRAVFESISKSGFDGALAIEYADPSIDLNEGLNGAIEYTRRLIKEYGIQSQSTQQKRRP